MIIETKYNIGEEVIASMALQRNQKVTIQGVYVSVEGGSVSVVYEVIPNDGWEVPIRTYESNLFPIQRRNNK